MNEIKSISLLVMCAFLPICACASHAVELPQNALAQSPVIARVEPAKYLEAPPPVYPMVSRRFGEEGRVVLKVKVLAEGRSGDVIVESSSNFTRLDQAAVNAVSAWKFVPAKDRISGKSVDSWIMIPISFSLPRANLRYKASNGAGTSVVFQPH